MRRVVFLIVSFLLLTAAPASAEDVVRNLRFSPGSDGAVVSGRITGYDTAVYLLDVKAGQRLRVSMSASNSQNYFNIVSPVGTQVHNGSMSGGSFSGITKRSGKYRIEVYLMRAAARRDEESRYKLSVTIPAGYGDNEDDNSDYDNNDSYGGDDYGNDNYGGNDYADGNAGGPDRWMVRGVPVGDKLNMRMGPSASAPIVARLKNGAVVRNRGCRVNRGARWCRVTKITGETGWVNGRFLREY